jgi:hypothetical protein
MTKGDNMVEKRFDVENPNQTLPVFDAIHIRLYDSRDRNKVISALNRVEQNGSNLKIILYQHASLDSDLTIHLHRKTPDQSYLVSPQTMALSEELRDLGLVNNDVWIPVCCSKE